MKFDETLTLIQFLMYLFRLRPNLLTSHSGNKIRIVLEYDEETKEVEEVLNWLTRIGCKVPLCLYS